MTEGRPIRFIPHSAAEALALEIASAFGDETRLPVYLRFCREYPSAIVYRAFRAAQSMPAWRITKSRPALFFYLVRTYAHQA